ncbi:MAG: zinc ribbon domain-containing protein [Gammaproteobacteria bacterium]|jgi:putative FmdB family regulatory protein|nr:zinc ribbon domain-containing protein [Gammaproteobacteria bacterium]
MPIYEYACQSCGHALEQLQKLSDAPLVDCPECGRPELRKLVSAAGFVLKGSGWYATDFRDKGKKPDAAASSGDTASQGGAACGTGACGACD